jgi:hypothetical protein
MWLQALTDTAEREKLTAANRAEVIVRQQGKISMLCLRLHAEFARNSPAFRTKVLPPSSARKTFL